jgi:4-hydroxy-tetrahydrodipicolinate synthase
MRAIRGCITAMATPFDKDLEVDYEGLRSNAEFQIRNGVSGLVPLGTTGESPTISESERTKIIRTVVSAANGRVPVIVGTGTNSTEHTIKYTREAKELGADAVLIVSPYYNKPSQEGLYRHFEAISRAVSIPIIVYNIASRTGVNIETQTMLRISALDNVIGVKESSGNMNQIMDAVDQLPDDFIVLSGDDHLALPIIALGGQGLISVVSNLLPNKVSSMIDAALSGNMKTARRLHYELMPIFKGAFIETSPVPIKTAMRLSGMPAGGVRLPLYEMSQNNLERLKSVLYRYKELRVVKQYRK